MDRKWLLIGLVGLVALLCRDDGKVTQLSEIKRRRSRRLFYISNGKVVPRSEVDSARRMARSGYGKVFAVWAFNADEAREYIRQGKAETVGGFGYTPEKEKFTKNEKILIEYFQTSLKNHIRLNPKSKTNEIYNLSSAKHYGIDLPKTITRNDLTKLASKIPDALEIGKDFGMPTIIQFNKKILDIKTHTIPEQTSFTERSQMTLFGLGRLSKVERERIESFTR